MMSNRERLLVRMVKHGATKVTMRELAEKAQLVWRIGAGEEVSTTCVHLEEWMASAARSCRSALDVMKREVAATGIGQFGAPARAVDQGGSEEFLETSDLMANGRFRQAEALGRIAISIVRGRGVKRAQRGKRWQRGLALRHCPSVRQM